MKIFSIVSIGLFLLIQISCNTDRREKELQQKQEMLDQKEQELILKEKTLQLKEVELLARETKLDSTLQTDSTSVYDSTLLGKWAVKMVCTETSCSGSAVGDTKTELWEITMEGKSFIAKAMSGEQLIRVYSGLFTGNTLELIAETEKSSEQPAAKIVARLHIVNESRLEGTREIVRENDCKTTFTMEMQKQ
jgi:hypothetical protein